jgi:hypothetical protein
VLVGQAILDASPSLVEWDVVTAEVGQLLSDLTSRDLNALVPERFDNLASRFFDICAHRFVNLVCAGELIEWTTRRRLVSSGQLSFISIWGRKTPIQPI